VPSDGFIQFAITLTEQQLRLFPRLFPPADSTKREITDDKKDRNAGLNLLEAFPLSVQFFTSLTTTKTDQPKTQNDNFQFPEQASLFLAGSWGSTWEVLFRLRGCHTA
jgi:hypothetical protein